MTLDPCALQIAAAALRERLRLEADEQNAYHHSFPDGRVSVELEWLDIASIVQQVVGAYFEQVANPRNGSGLAGDKA